MIPVYNESEVLDVLFEHLDRTFSDDVLAEKRLSRVRYVLVDDGSTDDTARIIAAKIHDGSPALLIRLSRNFGHASAIPRNSMPNLSSGLGSSIGFLKTIFAIIS